MLGYALLSSVACILLAHFISRQVKQRRRGPLPPGPSGLPLVGNIRDLPPPGTLEWTHWLKHGEKYGPISSVTLLGQVFVLLHDRKAIFDILENRALKSASRPNLVFAGEIVGYKGVMGMMPFNRTFRLHRKLTATQVGPKSIQRFEPIQEQEILKFMKRLLNRDPNNLQSDLNQISGSIMLHILYNYETKSQTDPIVVNSNQVMEEFSKSTSPGAWTVDLIPWLRYLPEWMPGAGFKKTAKIYRDHLKHNVEDPYNYVREQMAKGNDDVSYVAGLIKDVNRKIDPEEEAVISWTAASMFNAGTDTTGAVLYSFFLAMALYPEVQKQVQDEIDRVVGDSRLPSFSDKVKLPYIEAMIQEIIRWHTLAPMGFPHMTTEDDVYNGYFIPKNTLILPAVASLAHDPAVYHEPTAFKPGRFLEPYNEPSAYDVAFGFGRRACPGKYIAEQTMFLVVAQTLAVFSIEKAVDEQGKTVEIDYEALPGVISRVKPFAHRVTVRSSKHRSLVE